MSVVPDFAATAFTVAVTYASGPPTVVVSGDVDLGTAGHLAAIMQTVTDPPPRRLVLDLAGVGFLGAAGLDVIDTVAARLAPDGGRLVLRSPSRQLKRLLDICALTAEVDLDEEPAITGPPSDSAVDAGLVPHLRQLAAIPAHDDVVDAALRLVIALAQVAIEHADGVSVSLRRHGRLTTVAASDQTISAMDADQYATGEGPCVDASTHGRLFHADELDQDTRWPQFTPKARGLGINAILSSPLLVGGRPAGALNMYSRTSQAFAQRDQEMAETFTVQASRLLTDAGVGLTDDAVSTQVDASLRARTDIAQAQGFLMNRENCTAEEAFTVLRRLSVGTGRPLVQVAAHVIAEQPPRPGR